MADQPTPPLNANSPIVDPNSGKPKPPFILLINQLLKSTVGSASAIAQQALEAATAAKMAVTKLAKTKIIAGAGLDGGGPISADVTLNLEDTAVTPGPYGDATNVPQITVDQQGRITGVVLVPITGGGGGGGGGGAPDTAQHWRLRGARAVGGHQGDGFGLVNLQWLDSGGTNLVGAGTPSASNTDGSWNLAQGFQSNMGGGKGWYSANGDVNIFATSWIAYDFLAPVTPKQFCFAPLNGFTWTIGTLLWVENSTDGEVWFIKQIINVRPGANATLETYDIESPGGGGGEPWYFDPPTTATFTAFSGDGTAAVLVDDADVGLIVEYGNTNNGGTIVRGGFIAPPAGVNYSIVAHIAVDMPVGSYAAGGITLVETGSGKAHMNGVTEGNRYQARSFTVTGGFTGATTTNNVWDTRWFRTDVDFTNNEVRSYYSTSGKRWVLFDTRSITGAFTTAPDKIGIAGWSQSQTGVGFVSCDSWSVT